MNELAEWINTDQGAELTGYSTAYVRYLVRSGRVEGCKVTRDWLVNRESLLAYKQRMDSLGPQKHNPWREELPEGSGRKREQEGEL